MRTKIPKQTILTPQGLILIFPERVDGHYILKRVTKKLSHFFPRFFRYVGIDSVSIANNHIGDYKDEGVRNTTEILKRNHINYFGLNYGDPYSQQVRNSLIDVLHRVFFIRIPFFHLSLDILNLIFKSSLKIFL